MNNLKSIYENVLNEEKVSVTYCGTLRDGGSIPLEFSDGFKCMYDNGIGSKSRKNFVNSWKDRTIIKLDQKYIDALKECDNFDIKNFDTL